jgi:hypothetical protein
VVRASRAELMVSSAASSSGSSSGLRNASRKMASIRVWVALPPAHRDAFFPDPRAAAPGPVDAVQDLLLRVGQRQLPPAPRVPFQLVEPFVLVVLVQSLVHPRTLVPSGHDLAT